MDRLSIPIPEGLDEAQKAELTAWLTDQVADLLPSRLPDESDEAWRAKVLASIKRGMADVEAGRVLTSQQARERIAAKLRLPRTA